MVVVSLFVMFVIAGAIVKLTGQNASRRAAESYHYSDSQNVLSKMPASRPPNAVSRNLICSAQRGDAMQMTKISAVLEQIGMRTATDKHNIHGVDMFYPNKQEVGQYMTFTIITVIAFEAVRSVPRRDACKARLLKF